MSMDDRLFYESVRDVFDDVKQRIINDVWTYQTLKVWFESDKDHTIQEEGHDGVTAADILHKIQDFIDQKPQNVHYAIFLELLNKFPKSMTARKVSPLLKILIGFSYHLGAPNESDPEQTKLHKISYEDLAKIFARSKATISECIIQTEKAWQEAQRELSRQKEIEEQAERDLIEEKKAQLRVVKENSNQPTRMNEQVT